MKGHATLSGILSPGTALLAACLVCSNAYGQAKPPEPEPQSAKHNAPRSSNYVLEIGDGILLTGGKKGPAKLSAIVDVLRDQYQDVNIVLAPELGEVVIQDLKLRAAEMPEILEALRVASGEAFIWHKGLAPTTLIDPNTGLPHPSPAGSSSLYILSRNDAPQPENPRRMVQVFNLSGYLEHLGKRDEKDISASLEQITSIVSETLDQATQGKAEAGSQPSFKFHPGANLFIVIGSPQAIEVTEKVVNALPGVGGARGYPPQNAETRLMDDAFRRRYGLEPRPGSPTTVPTPPPPAKR
ncbi:MAG TPA: hypothetical protein VJA21_06160 [Verrucomicrobiae bacterium]